MQELKGNADALLEQARSVAQSNNAASADCLRQYLAREHVLTWLASVTQNPTEALAAAKLAVCLDPEDEVAWQVIATVYREGVTTGQVSLHGATGGAGPRERGEAQDPARRTGCAAGLGPAGGAVGQQ
jgi:hypothetical protein